MKPLFFHPLLFLFSLTVLPVWTGACSTRSGADKNPTEADTVVFRHARLLRAERCDSFVRVDVADAWHKGRTLHTYLLVPRTQKLPDALPRGTVVRTPLSRAVAFSSVHAALLAFELKESRRLAGVCDASYIVDDNLRQFVRNGVWKDFGRSVHPDTEALRHAGADALLVSPFENAGHGALSATGIPVVECADYMEHTPLGRAEWMRFYGMLFGCGERADSLFGEIERAYIRLSRKAGRSVRRPRVMMDLPVSSDVWYVPGGGSATGRLLADAGTDYLFTRHDAAGGIPVTFEEGLAAAAHADVWIVRYGRSTDFTAETFAGEYPRLSVPATAGCALWGCNTLRLPFYERTPFRPERLLAEFVALFHPRLADGRRPQYFRLIRKPEKQSPGQSKLTGR